MGLTQFNYKIDNPWPSQRSRLFSCPNPNYSLYPH